MYLRITIHLFIHSFITFNLIKICLSIYHPSVFFLFSFLGGAGGLGGSRGREGGGSQGKREWGRRRSFPWTTTMTEEKGSVSPTLFHSVQMAPISHCPHSPPHIYNRHQAKRCTRMQSSKDNLRQNVYSSDENEQFVDWL